MHLYLNYAREHWMHENENPPVGLILCSQKDEAVARYALDGLPNKVMAAEYKTALPDEEILAAEIDRTRQVLSRRDLLPEEEIVKKKMLNQHTLDDIIRRKVIRAAIVSQSAHHQGEEDTLDFTGRIYEGASLFRPQRRIG